MYLYWFRELQVQKQRDVNVPADYDCDDDNIEKYRDILRAGFIYLRHVIVDKC